MNEDKLHQRCKKFLKQFKVKGETKIKLKDYDCDELAHFEEHGKADAQAKLEQGIELISELQERLYASKKAGILIILQAMDAAGKDGAIKHVMSGVNPQGCCVTSFKTPSSEEHAHDFLWRCMPHLPERGMMSIFNRSYYESVLVLKVHPEWLGAEGFSEAEIAKPERLFKQRYRSIRNLEEHLSCNKTKIIKIFLHLSEKEQKKRFLSRLDTPSKNWKLSSNDIKEREHWDDYQKAFEDCINATSSPEAPWLIVPADHKWFARLVCMAAILEALLEIDPQFPAVTEKQAAEFPQIRAALEADKPD
ncbi:MAG: PPK2 family polyphosphate kinase [Akkermansia sp.]